MTKAGFLALAIFVVLPSGIARAQITDDPKAPFPDPDKFARGIYSDGEMGTLFFLGKARKPLGFGTAVGARTGYDLLRWVSVQAHAMGSTHETDFGTEPQSGQLLQLYQIMAELKVSVPIGQVSIFANGGGGIGYFSTNILSTTSLKVDSQTTTILGAGGGLDYHTLSRHFSFGLGGAYLKLAKLSASPGGVSVAAYVRYTF